MELGEGEVWEWDGEDGRELEVRKGEGEVS